MLHGADILKQQPVCLGMCVCIKWKTAPTYSKVKLSDTIGSKLEVAYLKKITKVFSSYQIQIYFQQRYISFPLHHFPDYY